MKKKTETQNHKVAQGVDANSKRDTEKDKDTSSDKKDQKLSKEKREPSPEEKIEKLNTKYLYLRAEFDNYKKNTIKEQSQLIKYANESILLAFLDVFDNFEHALSSDLSSENIKEFKKGVTLIAEEFQKFLTQFNVKEIPSLGKEFDPNIHEALGSEETDGKISPGHILRVYKKPYTLHDKVIRYGQVVVAKEKMKDKN